MIPKYVINITTEDERIYGSMKIPKTIKNPSKLIIGSIGNNFEDAKSKLEEWIKLNKNGFDSLKIEVESIPKEVLYGIQRKISETNIKKIQDYFNQKFN